MISDNEIIQRLAANEGIMLMPYTCPSGKTTIGIGHNVDDNPFTSEELKALGDWRHGITKEAAFYILRNDIQRVKEQINNNFPWAKNLSDDRQYVLIDLVFQMGISGVKKFKKTLLFLSTGFFNEAAEELMDSKYAQQTPKRAKRNSRCIKTGIYRF